MDKLIQIIDEK